MRCIIILNFYIFTVTKYNEFRFCFQPRLQALKIEYYENNWKHTGVGGKVDYKIQKQNR